MCPKHRKTAPHSFLIQMIQKTYLMTRSRLLLATMIVLASTLSLVAQKYSNEFLSIGVGARAQAMGNAVIASTNDVYAGVWNPAGLAALRPDDGLQLSAMHSEWFGGVGHRTKPRVSKDQRCAQCGALL